MPLDRVSGQLFGPLADHASGDVDGCWRGELLRARSLMRSSSQGRPGEVGGAFFLSSRRHPVPPGTFRVLSHSDMRIWSRVSPRHRGLCARTGPRLLRSLSPLLIGLVGLFAASVAQAQSVTVEYRVLGESRTAQVITQSIEVRVTNAGPGAMFSTSATISAIATMPMDPLGTVSIGDVPAGFMASRLATISFSVANEPTVRSAPGLSFVLTFFDAAAQQRQISALGEQIP